VRRKGNWRLRGPRNSSCAVLQEKILKRDKLELIEYFMTEFVGGD
jgi:hypothetical protein